MADFSFEENGQAAALLGRRLGRLVLF